VAGSVNVLVAFRDGTFRRHHAATVSRGLTQAGLVAEYIVTAAGLEHFYPVSGVLYVSNEVTPESQVTSG